MVLFRDCSGKYQAEVGKSIQFSSADDINNFLSFQLKPPCFKIMSFGEFVSEYQTVLPQTNANTSIKKTCRGLASKIGNEAIDALKNDSKLQHSVLVKTLGKNTKPIVLAHAVYEYGPKQVTIHYICKCSGTQDETKTPLLSKSCKLSKIASLMIYYIAFEAKEVFKKFYDSNATYNLNLISDKDGKEKLEKYYMSLGFEPTRGVDSPLGTPMTLTVTDKTIFHLR